MLDTAYKFYQQLYSVELTDIFAQEVLLDRCPSAQISKRDNKDIAENEILEILSKTKGNTAPSSDGLL